MFKKNEVYTAYAAENDITFIMRDTFDMLGDPESTAVIGWYYGEPNEESTRQYAGDLIAYYK